MKVNGSLSSVQVLIHKDSPERIEAVYGGKDLRNRWASSGTGLTHEEIDLQLSLLA